MKKIKDFLKKHKKNILIISIIVIILILLLGFWWYYSNNSKSKEEKIKNTIIKKTKFDKDKVIFRNIKLDKKKNQYTAEMIYNTIIFEFVIDADTGKIIKNNFDDYPDKEYKSPIEYTYIDKKRAKALVANELNADVKDVEFLKIDLKKDVYSAIYTIKASYKNYLYTYKIDAISDSIMPKYTQKIEKK